VDLLMTCKKCMTLRAKFVRWLGIRLGVMEPIKEQPKKETRMEWTQDQIAAVIGTKELELISMRMQLAQALARIKELEPAVQEEKKLEAVK